MRGVRLALGAGGLLVLALLLIVLSQSDTRLAATHAQVKVSGVAVGLYPGPRRCQRQDIPERAASVRSPCAAPGERATGPIDLRS